MDKNVLSKLISENYSSRMIAQELNTSQTTVRYWVKKYNLKFNGRYKIENGINLNDFIIFSKSVNSISELLSKLNLDISSSNYRLLKRIASENKIILPNGRLLNVYRKPDEDFENRIFIENSKVSRNTVKRRLRKEGRGDTCEICGISEWNGKMLSMRLDHVNGISNDNLKTNLRFVCPNCDSQLDTYCGKNTKR